MLPESSPGDLFRYVLLRPPNSPNNAHQIAILETSEFAQRILAAENKQEVANTFIQSDDRYVSNLDQLTYGPEILAAIMQTSEFEEPSITFFLDTLAQEGVPPTDSIVALQNDAAFGEDLTMLSDTLIALLYTDLAVRITRDFEVIYRGYELVRAYTPPSDDDVTPPLSVAGSGMVPWDVILRMPLILESLSAKNNRIRPVGFGDLQVVKQQIKRYEPSDIAHIENVLRSEKRSRTHRRLDRMEETFFSEFERTREQENELQTTERFELNQETTRTIQQDQKMNFGLNLSGKYGMTVEFSSEFAYATSESMESTNKNSSTFAKDIVERSLERIVERVREQRTLRILRETEEVNLHEFDNDSDQNIRGVYQFVDKVYEAQVFSYGARMMYDFVVLEPATYLNNPPDESPLKNLMRPTSPPELTIKNASEITDIDYFEYAAIYDAESIVPPPPRHMTASAVLTTDGDKDESGIALGEYTTNIDLPAGYLPESATVACNFVTNDDRTAFYVSVGGEDVQVILKDEKDLLEGENISDKYAKGVTPFYEVRQIVFEQSERYHMDTTSKLQIGFVAFNTAKFSVAVTVFCVRSDEHFKEWQLKTYELIQAAYNSQYAEYQEKLSEYQAQRELLEQEAEEETRAAFDDPPSVKRVMARTELKKHCLTLLRDSEFSGSSAFSEPGVLDTEQWREEGVTISFFERAFEWEQMQYVFYPYFWGSEDNWRKALEINEADPEFREFLRAGAARVVVPVRLGFESAVQHYIDTGKIWNGGATPPDITSPLYFSIVDEIRDRTGASKGEIPIGDPWEVRVPTDLVYLREFDDLPEWEQLPLGTWHWQPAEQEPQYRLEISRLDLHLGPNEDPVMTIEDGATISLEELGTDRVFFRVETDPEIIGSVRLKLNDGQETNLQSDFPYFLRNVQVQPGPQKLIATPYSGPKASGIAGKPFEIEFTFV